MYRAGRPVDALRSIEDARRTLADDIGVGLGPDLRAVEAAILGHDDSLAWHPPTPEPDQTDLVTLTPASRPADEADEPLYGRDGEVATLIDMIDRVTAGGRSLIVSGEAGIGKTAVVRRLRAEAGRRGIPTGWGRCPESAGAAPYRPWRTAIGQLPTSAATAALEAALRRG